jgi:LPXTG-motif cell wall-anchored protein
MRKIVVTLALAISLLGSWALPTAAQNNGLVIQNNGVDSTNSAAGADNVRISRAPGKSSSNNGGGAGNQEKKAVREPKDRKDRNGGKNGGEEAAPADETASAPDQGNLEGFSGDQGYVDPNAAPVEAPQPASPASQSSNAPIKLPNTGAGSGDSLAVLALVAALASLGFGAAASRRRAV